MGIQYAHALGRTQHVAIMAQTALATGVLTYGATDMMSVLKTSFSAKRERKKDMSGRLSRDLLQRFGGKMEVEWSLEKYIQPSGAAGTAPDDDLLLQAVLGPATIDSGVSVTYAPTSTQAPIPHTIVRNTESASQEALIGAIVNGCKFTFAGESESKIEYTGRARELRKMAGAITQASGGASAATTVTVTSGQARRLFVGARIAVETSTGVFNDNAGAGYRVTDITGNVITVTPAFAANVLTGGRLRPHIIVPTLTGTPIDGVNGAFTIDAGNVPIIGGEITVENNMLYEDKRYGSQYLDDAAKGYRDITGTLNLLLTEETGHYFSDLDLYTARDLAIVFGTTAGGIATLNLNYCEFDLHALEIPEAEMSTIAIPFVARGNGAGENGFSLVMT